MGSATEQASAQVAATRQRLDAGLDRLERRLRRELDLGHRLRRDGARIAAGAAVVVVLGTVIVIRRRRHRDQAVPVDWIEAMPEEWRLRLQELLAEAASAGRLESRDGGRPKPRGRPLWQSLGMRAGRLAAPVVINSVADRLSGRRGSG